MLMCMYVHMCGTKGAIGNRISIVYSYKMHVSIEIGCANEAEILRNRCKEENVHTHVFDMFCELYHNVVKFAYIPIFAFQSLKSLPLLIFIKLEIKQN